MRLVDSAAGRMTRILLALPAFAVEHFGPPVRAVVTALPEDAALDILVSRSAADTVAEWLRGRAGRVNLVLAQDDLDYSHWVQDALLAATAADGTPRLLLSRRFERYQDAEAARRLAAGAGIPLTESDLAFEGGNVLPCGERLLLGADTAHQNGGDVSTLTSTLDGAREPLVLGCDGPVPVEQTRAAAHPGEGWTETLHYRVSDTSHQPLFHIDLMVTPAGEAEDARPCFLVGCPRLGAQALGHPLLDHANAGAFDDLAEALGRAGVRVVRNPQPLVWMDDVDERHRTWFHLPVNNVLVEDRGAGRRRVWLPCFGQDHWSELAVVDDANAAVWEDLGFDVQRVPGLLMLAENRGALRCMCKVMARNSG